MEPDNPTYKRYLRYLRHAVRITQMNYHWPFVVYWLEQAHDCVKRYLYYDKDNTYCKERLSRVSVLVAHFGGQHERK